MGSIYWWAFCSLTWWRTASQFVAAAFALAAVHVFTSELAREQCALGKREQFPIFLGLVLAVDYRRMTWVRWFCTNHMWISPFLVSTFRIYIFFFCGNALNNTLNLCSTSHWTGSWGSKIKDGNVQLACSPACFLFGSGNWFNPSWDQHDSVWV